MKLKLEFGLGDGTEYISWYKEVLDFYKLIRYKGSAWEFTMYNKETNWHYDYTLIFTKTSNYTGSFYSIPTFEELFGVTSGPPKCECGAKFDRHAPNNHMFYCKLWKPRN